MASVTVGDIQRRLLHAIRNRVDAKVLTQYRDADVRRMISDVQRDINQIGQFQIDRWYRKTGSTNAEANDTNYVNYKLNAKILDIIRFRYEVTTYEDEYYTVVNDRIVLKSPVSADSDYQMEILYWRDTIDVESTTDAIDLPNGVMGILEGLVKIKMLSELDKEMNPNAYPEALAGQVQMITRMSESMDRMYRLRSTGVRPYYFGTSGGSDMYDITKNYITSDNFQVDANGNYLHRDEA